jgi:hypothetical protein
VLVKVLKSALTTKWPCLTAKKLKKICISKEISLVGLAAGVNFTFYEQLFCTKVFCEAFLCLQFGYAIFLAKEYWCKSRS